MGGPGGPAAKVEKIVSKEAIIQAVAGWGEDLSPNAIEVYVSRLRSKLEPAGIKIRTVRGFGYMLEEFKPAAPLGSPRAASAHTCCACCCRRSRRCSRSGPWSRTTRRASLTTEAYDPALVDIGIALGAHIQSRDQRISFRPAGRGRAGAAHRSPRPHLLPRAQPSGVHIAGDGSARAAGREAQAYNGVVDGAAVRVVSVQAPCGGAPCTVLVAERP